MLQFLHINGEPWNMTELRFCFWEVKPSAALPGDGLYEGMDWLTTRKVEPK